MNTRTIEQRIKFDSGLPIGQSLVKFTLAGREVLALVEIGKRGKVSYLKKPDTGDMYSSWTEQRGDTSHTGKGRIIVWGARAPEIMALFDGEPVAIIALDDTTGGVVALARHGITP